MARKALDDSAGRRALLPDHHRLNWIGLAPALQSSPDAAIIPRMRSSD
jgi:hypothetical protein